jgi:hypothetical protein
MPNINDIFQAIPDITARGKTLLEKAYKFAQKAHEGQLRKSGEPYFVHVFKTAKNLADLGMGPTVITAGFLHDVLEDTKTTEEELTKEFNQEIVSLVKGVTKLGTVKYKGIERNVENLRRFFVSMTEDLRVLVIKLADRLHNIETLEHVRPDKQKRIALETLEVYKTISEKATATKKRRIASGELIPWTRGNSCKNDERMVRMITNNKFKPSYNPKAIPYIVDILNVKYGTEFRHGESVGGEFKIYDKQEGRFYYADAYCAEQNIWVEFDEKCHYLGGQLKQECIFREERVRELLDCMFLRIQFFTDRKYGNH